MSTYAQPSNRDLSRLTAHQRHLVLTNVYWRSPVVLAGRTRSPLSRFASRHGERV